jgi:hypothetical protein
MRATNSLNKVRRHAWNVLGLGRNNSSHTQPHSARNARFLSEWGLERREKATELDIMNGAAEKAMDCNE